MEAVSFRLVSSRFASTSLVWGLVGLAGVLCACKSPNPAFDPDAGEEESESDTGMTMPPEEEENNSGVWWCAQVSDDPGALALFDGDDPEPIYEPPITEQVQPWDCRCAHEDLDAFFDAEMGQALDLEVTSSLQSEWENNNGVGEGPLFFRNSLYAAVEARCIELADDQWPGRHGDNCSTRMDSSEPGVTPIEPRGDCTPMETYGDGPNMLPMPQDHWSDYYTLSSVISYSSGFNVYYINGGFFNVMMDNPEWLIEDGAYIDHNGTDYQFYNVTSGSIAHALGIQSGDIPQTLNDIDITTVEGVLEAWEDLQTETTFELVLLRGTNTIDLDYQVVFTG